MQVESTKQFTPVKKGKMIGAAAGLGAAGAYVVKNRKDIILDRGAQCVSAAQKNLKDSFLKGVSETAKANIKEQAGQTMFINKMSDAFKNLVKGDKEGFHKVTAATAEALGEKKDAYINLMKKVPENFAKTVKNANVKGIVIGSTVAAGVIGLGTITGKLIGGLVGNLFEKHNNKNAEVNS